MESSDTEIILSLRVPGTLQIIKEGTKSRLYRLYYSGDSQSKEARLIGTVCHTKLVKALPLFYFGRAVIKTQRMGPLAVRDRGETMRLKRWLEKPSQ